MFDRFHHDARAAVAHAKDEAARSGQPEVGTEHLLLGLMARPGHASDALKAAGADEADLRERITGQAGDTGEPASPASAPPDAAASGAASPGTGSAPESEADVQAELSDPDALLLTKNAKRALERAQEAAQRLRHQHVSTGHVLLGVLDQPESQGTAALTVAGIHVGTLRLDVLRRMEGTPEPGQR